MEERLERRADERHRAIMAIHNMLDMRLDPLCYITVSYICWVLMISSWPIVFLTERNHWTRCPLLILSHRACCQNRASKEALPIPRSGETSSTQKKCLRRERPSRIDLQSWTIKRHVRPMGYNMPSLVSSKYDMRRLSKLMKGGKGEPMSGIGLSQYAGYALRPQTVFEFENKVSAVIVASLNHCQWQPYFQQILFNRSILLMLDNWLRRLLSQIQCNSTSTG